MRSLFVATILSIAAIGASAQPVGDNTVTIHGAGSGIELPATPRVMSAQDFGKFVGSYDLANGQVISLFTRVGGKYAVIRGEEPHELVAKSGNAFVAKDRQLAVTIDFRDNGEVSGEVLMVVARDKAVDGAAQRRVVSVALH